MIKKTGHNKDVTLAFGIVTKTDPLTVKLDDTGLETSTLVPLGHLLPAYYPAHIIFNDSLGQREASIMIDNELDQNDRVAVIYDDTDNKITGFILDKVEV
ncbi:DUF2577 family protein [Pseudobacillus wudalianchiensis]|nr:DUF2577 family protein [Bacillus wudalianchiensis]